MSRQAHEAAFAWAGLEPPAPLAQPQEAGSQTCCWTQLPKLASVLRTISKLHILCTPKDGDSYQTRPHNALLIVTVEDAARLAMCARIEACFPSGKSICC